jgi:putative ABC transport system permease protein
MFWINLKQAIRSLTSNKLRSLLTMLGIIIGVGAVITLVSLGAGANEAISRQFQELGSNTLTIYPTYSSPMMAESGVSGPGGAVVRSMVSYDPAQKPPQLTNDDVEALRLLGTALDLVAPSYNAFDTSVSGGNSFPTQLMGVTPEYQVLNELKLAQGRFIQEDDLKQRRSVVVISSDLAEALFAGQGKPALGGSFRLRRQVYTVVGVLAPEEANGVFSFRWSSNYTAYLPLSTAQVRLQNPNESEIAEIAVTTRDAENSELAKAQITSILRSAHRITPDYSNDFIIQDAQAIQEALQQSTGIMTILLSAIASISLLVGGIGIMNIMLVSVTERTREIGLRKSLGATRWNILGQFLLESIFLTVLGGAIGLGLGYAGGLLVSTLAAGSQDFGEIGLTAIVTPDAVFLALGVSVGIGLFFGIWPANRAARMSPIDALRYE